MVQIPLVPCVRLTDVGGEVSQLVKAEPKTEPVEPPADSLADLDGITDLLPIQTGQMVNGNNGH